MKPKINLPSGGSIVIESTEALTVIDVNSGKFTGGRNLEDTILKTNLEAAEELARQVRLRDIGGIIVVDFIDMSSEAARSKVIKALEDGLRRDRTRATIQSFSNLGLLEFTRKRVGKDLGAQLRGTCPTCSGMGSVMSSQSVAIETFRHIRSQVDGVPGGAIVAYVAPTVATQMDFWYEQECKDLSHRLAHPIRVRVDPMLHPEKSRVDVITAGSGSKANVIRVGDEHEVELLPGRLPNAASAAAVVENRIVEVENAVNDAGNTARIRILDVDDEDDYVLAELVTAAAADGRKRRRRGRAGKAALTVAEQAKQLRELAEEAAHQAQARAPIGITTVTEEEEAEDKTLIAEQRGEKQADAIIIAQGEVQHADEAGGEGVNKRRRRRRGRGGRGRGGEPAFVEPQPATPPPESEDEAEPAVAGESDRRHRRRRHRRRGRGGAGRDGTASEPTAPGFEPLTGSLPERPVPDRHIFRVGSDGAAEPSRHDRAARAVARYCDRARRPTAGRRAPAAEPLGDARAAQKDQACTPPANCRQRSECPGRRAGRNAGRRAAGA